MTLDAAGRGAAALGAACLGFDCLGLGAACLGLGAACCGLVTICGGAAWRTTGVTWRIFDPDWRGTDALGVGWRAVTIAGVCCLGTGGLGAGGFVPVAAEDLESACLRCSFKVLWTCCTACKFGN